MKRGAKARREALERALEGQRQAMAASVARRNTLLLRQEVLAVMARCLAEIAEHKRCFGFDDCEERRQLEAFRAETGLDLTVPSNSGGGSGGGGSSGGGRLWELPHTGGGGSLLNLERVTRADVEFCRTATFEQAAARLSAVVGPGAARLAELQGGACGRAAVPPLAISEDAAAPATAAAAREALAQVYDGLVRGSIPVSIYQPEVFMRINTQSYGDGSDFSGEVDFPQARWDALVRGAGLSMEQALLILDAMRLSQVRLARVWRERAALLAELAQQRATQPPMPAAPHATAAAANGHQVAGPSGNMACGHPAACVDGGQSSGAGGSGSGHGGAGCSGGQGGGGGCSGGGDGGGSSVGFGGEAPHVPGDWGDARASELVELLAATTAAERDIYISSTHALRAILTPEQLAWTMCAAYPWPVHATKCVQGMRHALVLDPRGAFPWAGPPVKIELADLLQDLAKP